MEMVGRCSTRVVLLGLVTIAVLVSVVMLRGDAVAQNARSCGGSSVLIGSYDTEAEAEAAGDAAMRDGDTGADPYYKQIGRSGTWYGDGNSGYTGAPYIVCGIVGERPDDTPPPGRPHGCGQGEHVIVASADSFVAGKAQGAHEGEETYSNVYTTEQGGGTYSVCGVYAPTLPPSTGTGQSGTRSITSTEEPKTATQQAEEEAVVEDAGCVEHETVIAAIRDYMDGDIERSAVVDLVNRYFDC